MIDKFRGIYMPYGIYDLSFQGNANAKGSKYAYRRGDYQYYHDYTITANDVDISYEGVSFDLVSKFYDNFSTSIPFHLKDTIPFDAAYMAGYYADCLDVKVETYSALAQQLVLPDETNRLSKRREYAKYGCSSPSIKLKCTPKIGMFPVYFLAVRNAKNDSVHYAVVNGQTGEVAIEIPIDFKKYCFLSMILSLVLFVVMNHSFTIKPNSALIFSFIASLICFFFSKNQLNRIEKKRKHEDDRGYLSINHDELESTISKSFFSSYSIVGMIVGIFVSMFVLMMLVPVWIKMAEVSFIQEHPFVLPIAISGIGVAIIASFTVLFSIASSKENSRKKNSLKTRYGEKAVEEMEKREKEAKKLRSRFLIKEKIAIILSLVVLVLNFVEDAIFYFAMIASLVLVVLSFNDLVKEHNILVSNKLPQLEKRGGDENA